MTNLFQNIFRYVISFVCTVAAFVAGTSVAAAFSSEYYAANSVLSSGKWVKISVEESGLYKLTLSDLRKMGFSNPENVRIYGYGGKTIPEELSTSVQNDDLPLVQSVNNSTGVIFYAQGVRFPVADAPHYRIDHNKFTDKAYYYVTESDVPLRDIPLSGLVPEPDGEKQTSFNEVIHYEKEMISPGETGHLFVGEDFRNTPVRNFKFNLPGRVENTDVWAKVSFVASSTQKSAVSVKANSNQIQSSQIDAVNSEYVHGRAVTPAGSFSMEGENLDIEVSYSTSGYARLANLDYIVVNYERALEFSGAQFPFMLKGTGKIGGVSASTILWDVTSPLKIYQVDMTSEGAFKSAFTSIRNYVVWNPDGTFPSPVIEGQVDNQDIHAMETPDMVIFTHREWAGQAERLAQFHRGEPDNMKVLVLQWDKVYNEFSSGSPDASAFRKCLKMFYDRPGEETHLKYAIMFGRSTYDNRKILAATHRNSMPSYQFVGNNMTTMGLSDNESFTTDDFFTLLKDGSSSSTAGNMSSAYQCIAVGRLSARTVSEATAMVDKIITFATSAPSGQWKNNMLFIADDQDGNAHLDQTETMSKALLSTPAGKNFVHNKVYIDAYPLVGNEYPEARAEMFRLIEEGTIWWNFIGHANSTSLTHERLLTYADMNAFYNRHWPVIYAATCNFMRWDSQNVSAAELLFLNQNGGVISAISSPRPVYIGENGKMSSAMGNELFNYDEKGLLIPIGEALRRAKNNLVGNTNKLRFVLLGDPALRYTAPSNKIVVTSINDVAVKEEYDDYDDIPTFMALQQASVKGYVADGFGNQLSDFSGTLSVTLYDADFSVMTYGHGEKGEPKNFDKHGTRLYAGSGKVENGEFNITISMPAEIADNYRNATLSLYALSDNSNDEAIGVTREFYVYGFDDSAAEDNVAPVINEYYINHNSFRNGDIVNPSPVAIATISDDVAINLSVAGVGHQMVMFLDQNERSYTDVSLYFTPFPDGTPGGTIAYPLENLQDGPHTLTLRIWDTGGNFAEQTIDFIVNAGAEPRIFDVYTDASPASAHANFYLSHNRPDAQVNVTMEIYNLAGQQVWTTTQSGRSDLFLSFPIRWNLCDMAGRRVPRGIYVYRASMTHADGTRSNSVGRKVAVTAP